MAITASHLEAWMTEAVLQRLDSVEMANALDGQTNDDQLTTELHAQVKTDSDRLAQLAVMWADGELDQSQWRAARTRLDERLTGNRRRLAQMRGTTVVDGWVGNSTQLRDLWSGLALTGQTAIVRAVLDHIVIHSATKPGRNGLDVTRVEPVWRL